MFRFVLATTVVGLTLAPVARPAAPLKELPPKSASANAVYVKIVLPVDPAIPPTVRKDCPVVESWIVKGFKDRPPGSFVAATAWVPLAEGRNDATDVWDGKVDDKRLACAVSADITERKGGRIKLLLRGWGPDGGEVAVTLDDEPGSREVAPATNAKTELGVPLVAVFIGPQTK